MERVHDGWCEMTWFGQKYCVGLVESFWTVWDLEAWKRW